MVSAFFTKLSRVFTDRALLNKVLVVLGLVAVFRVLAAIPVPGVDQAALASFFANNQFLGLLNIFSGGGLSSLSIVMLGVGPYITASIIMQLLTIMHPKVKAMYSEEGEAGRMKFTQWSRVLTIPLAIVQAISFTFLLQSQNIIPGLAPLDLVSSILVIAAGSIFLMWLGEMITEFGIGNGVSLIIFAGIVAGIPTALSQIVFSFTPDQIPGYLGFIILGLAVTYIVVLVTEAERAIPIAHARQVRGQSAARVSASTYLPIRLNQSGVIPLIFAISLLLLPQMVVNMVGFFLPAFRESSASVIAFLNDPWVFGGLYFFLVFIFTYFYTAITFEPARLSENLQKSGAFIPGIRPGPETEHFLGSVVTRTTFIGAVFLGAVAVVPFIVQGLTGLSNLIVGGTALLIAVSVVLDIVRKVDSQVSVKDY
jgi:preprotein translocase subunit SecY